MPGECLHPDWCGASDLCRNCRAPGRSGPRVLQCDRGCCGLEEWAERFSVVLECRYCRVQFDCSRPDASKEYAPGMGAHRLILVGAPDRCPKCNNGGVKPRPANVVDFKRSRPAR